MSEILVNTIKKADGTGGLTVPSGSGTVATLAGGTFTGDITMSGADLVVGSNSIFIGGTGSANELSDYEEGTFDPVITAVTSAPSVTYDSLRSGHYVKVGNLVYVGINVSWTSLSGGSGLARIGGFPILPASGDNQRALGSIPYLDAFTGLSNAYGMGLHTNLGSGTDGTYFFYHASNGNLASYVNISNFKSSGNLQINLLYQSA